MPPKTESETAMTIHAALSLCRNTSLRVRPVCWREDGDYLEWHESSRTFRRFYPGLQRGMPGVMQSLSPMVSEEELLGPWEVVK
jgi:hypothetical protein